MYSYKKNKYSIVQDGKNCITVMEGGKRIIYRSMYSKKLTKKELSEFLRDVLKAFRII